MMLIAALPILFEIVGYERVRRAAAAARDESFEGVSPTLENIAPLVIRIIAGSTPTLLMKLMVWVMLYLGAHPNLRLIVQIVSVVFLLGGFCLDMLAS